MIEQLRSAILTADEDNVLGGRVRPGIAAAGDALPLVTIDVSDSEPVQSLDATLGFIRNVAINIYAETRVQVRALADMVESAIAELVDIDGESETVESIAPESGNAMFSIVIRARAYESS
jgi:hypothetical protein